MTSSADGAVPHAVTAAVCGYTPPKFDPALSRMICAVNVCPAVTFSTTRDSVGVVASVCVIFTAAALPS